MKLHENGTIEAFALIVDINGFTQMVSKAGPSDGAAQFVRDVLSSGIDTIQKHGGSVVSFMGDAFLAILDNPDSVYMSCVGVAKDLDRQCEYVSEHQKEYPDDWHYAKGGTAVKLQSNMDGLTFPLFTAICLDNKGFLLVRLLIMQVG
jgi:hypothetical protein